MRFTATFVGVLAVLASGVLCAAAPKPNVLIILADDLGFSDLGSYGGEIDTPNLDSLAAGGLRFTQFYNTTRCWPTRAALLTGYYPQQVGFDVLPGAARSKSRQRPPWARLLPEYLRELGYRSYHSGKWHLDGGPAAGGFDRSYWLNEYDRYFSPQNHLLDDRPLPPVKRDSGYYATRTIVDYAIDFLREHTEQHAETPFFHYVAFTAPHFPLHALPEDIARYRDRYRVGWDVIRQERWRRMQELKLPGELSALESDIGPPYAFARAHAILGPPEVWREISWSELTPEQQEFQAAKMAIHAAMVDRLDREVGRLMEELRRTGALDNTLILFFSDNGASAEIMVRGDGHDPQAPAGSADSFLCLGPGWSSAANTPFRRHKTWTHEGGIATPLVVHWPAGISSRGALRHTVGHVIDIAPTIVQLAGGTWPAEYNGTKLPALSGRDLSPSFREEANIERDPLWWLHNGNRAIRNGNWKLVAAKGQPWELYDLSMDRAETTDLAKKYPKKVEALAGMWQERLAEFQVLARENGQR